MQRGLWLVDLLVKEGASYAEVRLHKNVGFGLLLKNGEPEPPEYAEAYGAAIRVICGGALSFASTNITSKKSLIEAGKKALKSAKAMSGKSKAVRFSDEKSHKKDWQAESKEDPLHVDSASVIEILKDIDADLPKVPGVKFPNRMLILGGSIEEKSFVNSEGADLTSRVPRVEGDFILTAHAGAKGTLQRIVQIGESGGWERVSAMDPLEKVKEEAKAMVDVLNRGAQPKPGRYNVIIGSEVTGIIAHEACGHPQEADRILGRESAQAGESYVKSDMQGRRIGSALVNISDDPTMPHSNGFYLYDDEGVEAGRRALMKNGTISGFLHSRETAFDFNTHSNAAMRATSYAREPIVRMSNTFVEAGDTSFEEMLEDCCSGIYVKSFQEWNIDDLRWNNRYVGLEAYAIESGVLGTPVRSPVIEATTEVLFSSVQAVGKEIKFSAATCGKGQPSQGAPVWTGGPALKMNGLFIKSR